MFFIFGISNGEKKLDFAQTMLCPYCGQYGGLEVYMTYICLTLFFIPTFKWNRRYYAKSTCCSMVFEIDSELGIRIHQGESVALKDSDLHVAGRQGQTPRRCSNCGYPAAPEFEFCPKCGYKHYKI